MTLTFTVPGKVASNNRVTRFQGRAPHKSAEAVSYQQRVFQHAFAAAKQQRWKIPEACVVRIEAYNVRLDIDNIAKCVLDGMIGAAYNDDRVVVSLSIGKRRDADEQRIIVIVGDAVPLAKPKRKKAA